MQTNNRFFDEMAKFMTDAAGAAQGLRQEFETMMRTQGEKFLRNMDIPQREEFETVKAMAEKAREENEELKKRIELLETMVRQLQREAENPAGRGPDSEPGLVV